MTKPTKYSTEATSNDDKTMKDLSSTQGVVVRPIGVTTPPSTGGVVVLGPIGVTTPPPVKYCQGRTPIRQYHQQ